jgi:hypothetical protein
VHLLLLAYSIRSVCCQVRCPSRSVVFSKLVSIICIHCSSLQREHERVQWHQSGNILTSLNIRLMSCRETII